MLSKEFLTEAFILRGKIGNGMTYGVSSHCPERAAQRHIPWSSVMRIIKRLPFIKPQLKQMIHFPQFYIRDEETDVELGCKFTDFGAPEVQLLYINTVVRSDHIRKTDTPIIIANTTK